VGLKKSYRSSGNTISPAIFGVTTQSNSLAPRTTVPAESQYTRSSPGTVVAQSISSVGRASSRRLPTPDNLIVTVNGSPTRRLEPSVRSVSRNSPTAPTKPTGFPEVGKATAVNDCGADIVEYVRGGLK